MEGYLSKIILDIWIKMKEEVQMSEQQGGEMCEGRFYIEELEIDYRDERLEGEKRSQKVHKNSRR